jgi:hypothetical protein
MVRETNEDRRHRMFERILNDLDANPALVPWLNAVATLRDRLIIGEPETCYLASMFAESAIFGAVGDPELDRIVADMQNIERANGLHPDESYGLDDAPPDWLALNTEWDARSDVITAQLLRDGGLGDLARMYVERRAQFDDRSEEGRSRLWELPFDDDHDDVNVPRGHNPAR